PRAEPVEIEMEHGQAAVDLVDERERRAADTRAGRDRVHEPGDEARLAGAELARQRHHVAGAQRGRERGPQALGRRRRRGALAGGAGGPPRAARGRSVTRGSTISSSDTPPCWNEPLNCRSYSWKRVGYTK